MCPTDDLVDDLRKALRRAESFGDLSGIVAAQWAYGTVLLRANKESRIEAMEVLECAQTNHPTAQGDGHHAGGDGCRSGDRRRPQGATGRQPSITFVPRFRCTSVAAVGSSRVFPARPWSRFSSTGDPSTTSPRRIESSTSGRAERPEFRRWTLWWLKSRALLAKAEGNSDAYAELANEYLALCERLDARGRLAEARRMVG